MKGFIASVITLCLLSGIVIWNSIWIRNKTGELLDIVHEIPDTPENAGDMCEKLSEKWDGCRKLMVMSVSHTEVELIDAGITSLLVYANKSSETDFAAALAALEEELEYLRLSESLTFDGIL